jgi:hypothetical protein
MTQKKGRFSPQEDAVIIAGTLRGDFARVTGAAINRDAKDVRSRVNRLRKQGNLPPSSNPRRSHGAHEEDGQISGDSRGFLDALAQEHGDWLARRQPAPPARSVPFRASIDA